MADPAFKSHSESGLVLNLSRWPLIEITNPLSFSQQDWDELIQQLVRVLKRDHPFSMLNDVRIGPPPSAQQRKAIAVMYRENLLLVKKNWRGTALVTNSALVKGAITAMNWLMPPPHPAAVFSRYDDAEAWAYGQLSLPVQPRSIRPEKELA